MASFVTSGFHRELAVKGELAGGHIPSLWVKQTTGWWFGT